MKQGKWAYGVTAVPQRRTTLLPKTLASLAAAGFPHPRVFVDGDAGPWPELTFATYRESPVRIHGNWILAAMELFVREPAAERYALFQDDILVVANLRTYLNRVEYPDHPAETRGYWNLYTCPANQDLARERGFYLSNQFGRGACALVFSRECLIQILSSRHMVERPVDPHRGWRSVDGGIVTALAKAGWKEYVHNPSLVKHVGKQRSTGGPDWPAYYDRTSFPGESFSAADLLR